MSSTPKFTTPLRATPQPGQTEGIHTYTHCVMCGDDAIATTLLKADANLFAAAPDPYAACESLLSVLKARGHDVGGAAADARSALAKARGEVKP